MLARDRQLRIMETLELARGQAALGFELEIAQVRLVRKSRGESDIAVLPSARGSAASGRKDRRSVTASGFR